MARLPWLASSIYHFHTLTVQPRTKQSATSALGTDASRQTACIRIRGPHRPYIQRAHIHDARRGLDGRRGVRCVCTAQVHSSGARAAAWLAAAGRHAPPRALDDAASHACDATSTSAAPLLPPVTAALEPATRRAALPHDLIVPARRRETNQGERGVCPQRPRRPTYSRVPRAVCIGAAACTGRTAAGKPGATRACVHLRGMDVGRIFCQCTGCVRRSRRAAGGRGAWPMGAAAGRQQRGVEHSRATRWPWCAAYVRIGPA